MVTKQPLIRSMRTVKRETLKLISGWVSRSNDPQMVRTRTHSLFNTVPGVVESLSILTVDCLLRTFIYVSGKQHITTHSVAEK